MIEPHAPVLEMLWEAHDPRRALDARFGFSDGQAAGRWVAATVAEHWGVRVDFCERIVMSDGNALAWVGTPGGRLLAKWSVVPERFPRLAEAARLTSWLDGRGLPVSAPVPARDGRLQAEVDGASMGLQRVIEGDLLDAADPRQVRAAGAVLARLQDAMAAYPDADRIPPFAAGSKPLTERVIGWLDARAGHLLAAARDVLRGLVAGAPPDRLPAEVRTEFLAGYQAVRPLTPAEAAWLDILLLWQALAMVPPGDDPTGWGSSALSQRPFCNT